MASRGSGIPRMYWVLARCEVWSGSLRPAGAAPDVRSYVVAGKTHTILRAPAARRRWMVARNRG